MGEKTEMNNNDKLKQPAEIKRNEPLHYGRLMIPAAESENDFNQTDRDLYSVIYHMSTKRGYCWASNHYLAVMLKLSPVAISNSVSKQKRMGYIRTKYTKDSHRHVYPETNEAILDRQRTNIAIYYKELEEAAQRMVSDEDENEDNPPLKESLSPLKESLSPLKESLSYNKEDNKRKKSFVVSKETTKGGANVAPRSITISIEEFLPNQGNENPAKKNHDPAAMKAALREQLPAPDNSSDELTWEDASEEARTMLEFWNAAGCGTQHKSDGPGARKALHVLDCVILPQGYSISKLVDAAEHFALVAKDGTQHISLSDFLVVSEFRKRAARNRKAPAPRPTFLEFYSDNGDGAAIIGEEEFRLYKSLKKAYIGWTLGVEQSESPLSLKEGRQLLQAAVKLKACMAKGWLDPYFVGSKPTHIDYINILFQGLKRKWKNDYTTGHVASDKIWDKWMPRFIQESRGISVIKMRESIEHDGQ